MANEFDKRYDALVEEMKASIKELLCKEEFNGITASDDYWMILHVVEEGTHESIDVIARTYYFIDDMIMASEDIPVESETEEVAPQRVNLEFCSSDSELTSYEQLTLAYENIKSVIDNYIK